MMTAQQVIEQLTGKWIVRELESYLEENFDDFYVVKRKYIDAIEQLRNDARTNLSPTVDDLVDAIKKQTASNLFFSGVLGVRANLDHFKDPMVRTVLDVDFDVYLHENAARRLPEYERAQEIIDAFFTTVHPVDREKLDAIIEYMTYMETIGPKLAHYYGYILGNGILYNLIPGYFTDDVFTMQYKSMLERYLGLERKIGL